MCLCASGCVPTAQRGSSWRIPPPPPPTAMHSPLPSCLSVSFSVLLAPPTIPFHFLCSLLFIASSCLLLPPLAPTSGFLPLFIRMLSCTPPLRDHWMGSACASDGHTHTHTHTRSCQSAASWLMNYCHKPQTTTTATPRCHLTA